MDWHVDFVRSGVRALWVWRGGAADPEIFKVLRLLLIIMNNIYKYLIFLQLDRQFCPFHFSHNYVKL